MYFVYITLLILNCFSFSESWGKMTVVRGAVKKF